MPFSHSAITVTSALLPPSVFGNLVFWCSGEMFHRQTGNQLCTLLPAWPSAPHLHPQSSVLVYSPLSFLCCLHCRQDTVPYLPPSLVASSVCPCSLLTGLSLPAPLSASLSLDLCFSCFRSVFLLITRLPFTRLWLFSPFNAACLGNV